MHRISIIAIFFILLPASSWAQEGAERWASACVIVPVFHCAQQLEGVGGAIGYFGYDLQCPDDAPATAEVYIDIDDNNLFSPGLKDRGQPKVFVSGEHFDEFEVDFSVAEMNAGYIIRWSVQGHTAMVDFSKTRDLHLDCSTMSY